MMSLFLATVADNVSITASTGDSMFLSMGRLSTLGSRRAAATISRLVIMLACVWR